MQAADLKALKDVAPFLREVPHHTLHQALLDLRHAIERWRSGAAGRPRYKGRYAGDSFRFPRHRHDAKGRRAGGVYLWHDIAAALRAPDQAWLERVRRAYGSEPVVRYLGAPLVVDNALGRTIGEADPAAQTAE
jgi:hypothetical protein